MHLMSCPPLPLDVRIARHVVRDDATGCLVWTGTKTPNGYGLLGRSDRPGKWRAHRLAYELAFGPIPEGYEIDHLCRNRACCNPDHLEAVTRQENIARGNGRAVHFVNAAKTHCPRGHAYTPENTRISCGRRHCRVCRSEQDRRARLEKTRELRPAEPRGAC